MPINLNNDWKELLTDEFEKDYYIQLCKTLKDEYKDKLIYPKMNEIYNALHYTSYIDTKVIIIGQDPYHGVNQAHGLCFSVKKEVTIPPSLLNIYKELRDDVGCSIPNHGSLIDWAKQGVLLLNTVLTVRAGSPASHRNIGWEIFTDNIINLLNKKENPLVFILWGKYAQSKEKFITNKIHHIIKSSHPSPFSAHRGFFGSKPFSQTNTYLISNENDPINWQID